MEFEFDNIDMRMSWEFSKIAMKGSLSGKTNRDQYCFSNVKTDNAGATINKHPK